METTWKAIDDDSGLFAIERVAPSGFCWRALAVRLDGGDLVVMSPLRGAAERAPADAIGKIAFALAPNHFHYLGIAELRARDARLQCVATRVASKRLEAKCGHALAPLDALRERLPEHVELLEPPGLKNGEAWLRIATSRGVAWAVCDAFFHVNNPLAGMMGLALRATGTAPGLRIGSTFLWLAAGDRRRYRAWLEERLRQDRPRILIPSHGDVLEDERLPDRLAELAARRL